MRINVMLPEYTIDGYEAYQSRGPRPHVDDEPAQPQDTHSEEFAAAI